jgi:hypothetical protein
VHQQRIQKQIEQLQAKYEKFYAEGIASYSLYDQLEETLCISLKQDSLVDGKKKLRTLVRELARKS